MATIIFDFDSTLITVESLEEILRPNLSPEQAEEIQRITDQGMTGGLDFFESLSRRLDLAAPNRAEVAAFGARARQLLTPGMDTLVADLLARDAGVRIVSGGLVEGILPVAAELGIGPDQVHAVRLDWDDDGRFLGIAPDCLFARSKVLGCRPLIDRWARPVIAVGDGATDFRLYEEGIADAFVAFTFNRNRPAVVTRAAHVADDIASLARILEQWL